MEEIYPHPLRHIYLVFRTNPDTPQAAGRKYMQRCSSRELAQLKTLAAAAAAEAEAEAFSLLISLLRRKSNSG
jgi:hypothetical protein